MLTACSGWVHGGGAAGHPVLAPGQDLLLPSGDISAAGDLLAELLVPWWKGTAEAGAGGAATRGGEA